jgi:copper chaperone
MNSYTFNVKMTCYGCVGAVIKALANSGITSVDVNLETQLVKVKSERSCQDVLQYIRSSGKKVEVVS